MTTDVIESAEQVQIAQVRGTIYRLLARCFYAPTRDLLDEVRGGSSTPLLRNLLETFQAGTLEEMLSSERNDAEGGHLSDDLLYQSLKQEYVRLFEGPGHMQVAPYESVHRKDVPEMERGLVMGACTVDARRRYAEAGLVMAKDFTDLPDHIAVELEFMSYLCFKQAEAGGSEKDGKFGAAQREFLREHLTKWLPEFCEAVVRESNARFYRDLAKMTHAYVTSEVVDLLEAEVTC